MKKVFLDTNIFIDYFDDQRRDHLDSFLLLTKAGKNYSLFCSMKTVLDVYYILGENNQAKKCVKRISQICTVIPGNLNNLNQALEMNNWKDLEDAFQYSIAIQNKADFIASHDKKGFKNSEIPVLRSLRLNEMFLDHV
ncbi:MAG: PIN domain-containing protein [Crocinitomicaceae bacterium]|nr:PIN domain-containing protein [Crocinitomicaceae bacterium]